MAIIDGKSLAERIKTKVAKEIASFKGERPNLAIILASDREDSKLYVSLKEKSAKTVGIDTNLYILDPEKTSQEEFLSVIDFLNKDETIDGILVQLPLPSKFDTDQIINAIDPEKDVDGFHPNHPEDVDSPVLGAADEIIKDLGFDAKGKVAAVVYNSEVFGQGAKAFFERLDASVVLVSPDDPKLPDKLFKSDIVLVAVGRPKFLGAECFNTEAVIIDVGITKVDGKVVGDVDFDAVKDHVAYITPVPGGVGPMTIALLFRNTLAIYKRRHKN